jgi:putative transposase
VPPELRRRVHDEVMRAKARSGWPAGKTLRALGVPPRSYYRWRRDEAAAATDPAKPPAKAVSPYAATAAERAAVIAYALEHPAVRHRELAWRMVDEDVACVSPSTVYRILQEARLVCPWRRRSKRSREECEKATRPDERWGTDLMHLQVGGRTYYYIGFLDEWSRCLVHHELLRSMDGASVSLAAQRAIDRWRRDVGPAAAAAEVRSDNGSGFVSREFHETLAGAGLRHQTIKPHCPEENGLMERSNRTIREAWEAAGEADDYYEAEAVLAKLVRWYNEERLHRALGYLRPVDYYRGRPEELREARRRKLAEARQRRKEANLNVRQPKLPLMDGSQTGEPVTNEPAVLCQNR